MAMRQYCSLVAPASCVLLAVLSALASPGAAFAPSRATVAQCLKSSTSQAFSSSVREVSPLREHRRPQAPPQCSRRLAYPYIPLRPYSLPSSSLSSNALPDEESTPSVGGGEVAAASSDGDSEGRSLLSRIRSYFAPKKDNLTFRQRLAKMGLNAVLAYGWVSNMSYCVTVSLAWYIFSKQTKMSPLAPGQWSGFLAVYLGFWVFNNFVRPIRLAVSVAISPQFDRIVSGIQVRLKVSKATAITITVVVANLIGTTSFMAAGILVASILAGVPIFPR